MLNPAHRVLVHPAQAAALRRRRPHAFDWPVELVGRTEPFAVYLDPRLAAPGRHVAASVLGTCEADYDLLRQYFALELPAAPRNLNVVILALSLKADGTGGAYHHRCSSTDLYCDLKLQPRVEPRLTSALLLAEVAEAFEAAQAAGWDCGTAHGEALSRVLAEHRYPNVLDGYATAAAWLDSSRPNWVDQTDLTDQNPVSTGCGVLFLWALHHQLELGWDAVCRAGAPTLADLYQKLMGRTDAWSWFSDLLAGLFPLGQPCGLFSDNPWLFAPTPA